MDLSLLQPGYLPRFEAEKSLEMKPTDRGSIGACGVRLPSTTQPMVDPDLVEYPNRQFYTISDVACGASRHAELLYGETQSPGFYLVSLGGQLSGRP